MTAVGESRTRYRFGRAITSVKLTTWLLPCTCLMALFYIKHYSRQYILPSHQNTKIITTSRKINMVFKHFQKRLTNSTAPVNTETPV